MHMIKGEAGVNKYDPRYQEIKASSDRGAGYTAEQQMLRTASEGTKAKWTSAKIKEAPYFRVGLDLPQPYPGRVFDYDIGDGAFDFASRNDEIPNRLGGAAQTLGGAVGTVGGVVGGVFTAETGVGAALGGGVAGVSAVVALDGAEQAFGPYKYTEGGKVLDSFDKPTPSYAADFGANIAIDTTAAIGLAAAGKALPVALNKVNGLLRGGTGKTGPPLKGGDVGRPNPQKFSADYKYFDVDTWTAPRGTEQTYKVYQRKDIDWNMVRTDGVEKFIGKTNLEAARAGKTPQLPDGKFATLHHIGQDARGPLVEASTKHHNKANKEAFRAIHGQHGANKPHPNYPTDHGNKWKADREQYWKSRAKDVK